MESYIDPICSIEEPPILDRTPTIVINFYGCNFSCPFCYAQEFLSFKENRLYQLKEIKNEIKRISPNADQILFTGGEPTLQKPALLNLANFAKNLNLNVILFTNASKFNTIKQLVDNQLVDKFLVTLFIPLKEQLFKKYTQSNTFFKRSSEIIESIKRSLEYINLNKSTIELEIVTPIIPTVNDNYEQMIKIAHFVYNLKVMWNIVPFSKKSPYDDTIIKNKFFQKVETPTIFQIHSLIDRIKKKYPYLNIKIRDNY